MNVVKTAIEGINIIEPKKILDSRGAFTRTYCYDTLHAALDLNINISQINVSETSHVGTIRGLHFQKPPFAEVKIIRCVRGKVFDVAVDLRKNSTTFLQWVSIVLTPESQSMIYIPEGCAHGFQSLENDSHLEYLHTQRYTPSSEGGVNFNDPILNIKWPLTASFISERDANLPFINANFLGITL